MAQGSAEGERAHTTSRLAGEGGGQHGQSPTSPPEFQPARTPRPPTCRGSPFAAPPTGTRPKTSLYVPGVYQIGLVYALSCVDVGAPSGMGMPKRNASYVVHRGVGISITRP